ncbi:MAG: hypothetical protein U9R50_05840 [Campylobacterota bacterium]|nr:hypothetical protein [Campylobacterota bacterium]
MTIVDDIRTKLFSTTPTIKRNATKKLLNFDHGLPEDIADSCIVGGAEFEFYISALSKDDFDQQLKSIISMLFQITDQDILCNPFKDFDRSREHDKLIIKPDSSLKMQSFGIEITTPIVSIVNLPYYIESIFTIMKRHNAVTDISTGFHIHLSCPDLDGEPFDFLGLMLLLNTHNLYETWPSRPDYSRNVMDVLNCLNFEVAAQKKDEIGRGWCVIRPEIENKPTHIEMRTMGGDGYHFKLKQVCLELIKIVNLYLLVLDGSAEEECASLIECQRTVIDTADDKKLEKLQEALAFIGYIYEEPTEQ